MSNNGKTNGHFTEETSELESQINDVLSNIKMFLNEIDEEKAVLEKYRKKIKHLHVDVGRHEGGHAKRVDVIIPEEYAPGRLDPVYGQRITSLIGISEKHAFFKDEKGAVFTVFAHSIFNELSKQERKEFWDRYNDVNIDTNNLMLKAKQILSGSEAALQNERILQIKNAFLCYWQDARVGTEIEKERLFLESKSKERFRSSVLKNAFWWLVGIVAVIAAMTSTGLMWEMQKPGWLPLTITIPFGMLGACISIIVRQDEVFPDPGIWKQLLWKEIMAKVLLGGISAPILLLFLVTGFFSVLPDPIATRNYLSVLILLAIVAGASERLLGSILAKAESSLKLEMRTPVVKPK